MNSYPVLLLPPHKLRRGFTLIELLTVIAIIGILAAILFPVIGKARLAAKRTEGMGNLRQVVIASLAFVIDNRGRWFFDTDRPTSADASNANNYYPRVITRYMGAGSSADPLDVFYDPLLPRGTTNLHFAALDMFFLNRAGNYPDVKYCNKISTIASPAKQVFFADNWVIQASGIGGNSTISNTGFSIYSWSGIYNAGSTPSAAYGASVPAATYGTGGGQIDLQRDPDQAKLGFIDGHVAIVKRTEMYHRLFDPRF